MALILFSMRNICSSKVKSLIAGIDMAVRNAQGRTSSIVSAANNQSKTGMVLPFQPLSLAFNHVNYYVDMPAVSHFLWLYISAFCKIVFLSMYMNFLIKFLGGLIRR